MKIWENENQRVLVGETSPSDVLSSFCDENDLGSDTLIECAVDVACFDPDWAACESSG